jgi:hypothetical protein
MAEPLKYVGDIPKEGFKNVVWVGPDGREVAAGAPGAVPRLDPADYPGHGMPTMGVPGAPGQRQIVPAQVANVLRGVNDPNKFRFLTDYFKSQFHPDIQSKLPAYESSIQPDVHTLGNPEDEQRITEMLTGISPMQTMEGGDLSWTALYPEKKPVERKFAGELNAAMLAHKNFPDRLRAFLEEGYVDEDDQIHEHLPGLGKFNQGDMPGNIGFFGGFNPDWGGWGGFDTGGYTGGTLTLPPGPGPGAPHWEQPPKKDGPGGGGGGGGGGNGNGDDGPGSALYNPNFSAWPGYPNINYPGRNSATDPNTGDYLPGYNFKQYAHTSRQPDPMWGGGPQSWNSGWPESNAWLGGMQPLMANDPWALTESGIQAGMLPPTTENFFGGYWDGLSPPRDYTRFGDPGSLSSPWGPGWLDYNIGPDVQWENVPYTGHRIPQTQLPTPVIPERYTGAPGDDFMDRAGVTQQQYNLAQDPGGWRGGQTFGQRTGMSQEAYNASRNAASQAALPSGYGQPVQGPGQFGGAFGTFDPTTEFGQQGGEPGNAFANSMGVTQQQYNLAQDPGAWRGEQTFGERVGMSQEAYNTARNRATQMNKYGQPVQGPGEFGGAFGTFGPDDVGSGMVHPSQRALPPPTQTEPVPHTPFFGAPSPITPGTLGGRGTMPRRSSITPGRLGGGNMYGNQRRGY